MQVKIWTTKDSHLTSCELRWFPLLIPTSQSAKEPTNQFLLCKLCLASWKKQNMATSLTLNLSLNWALVHSNLGLSELLEDWL